MNRAIKVCGLKKSYGSHIVLRGLDLQIETGEIFAFAWHKWCRKKQRLSNVLKV